MNSSNALRAAIAGIGAVACFLAALFVSVYASFSGGGFLSTSWQFEDMEFLALFIWFAVVPCILVVGGTLPAFALGAAWWPAPR